MMNNSDRKSKRQTIGLVLLLVSALLGIILFLTLTAPEGKKIFTARDINDASYDCEDKINREYGDILISKQFDNLSSRYEADKKRYAIFYRISLNEKKPKQRYREVSDYMVKCVVWEKLGYVSEFTLFDF